MDAELIHLRSGDGFDDVMDVNRLAAGVRPQADVDLSGGEQLVYDRGGPVRQRPQRGGLIGGQAGDARDVAQRLDQQGADAERTDAVLHSPAAAIENRPAGQRPPARGQITGEAPDDVRDRRVGLDHPAAAGLETEAMKARNAWLKG
jgi:hypothetical protein